MPEVGLHTMLFRFGLPEGHALGLPIGQHISIKGTNLEGKEVIRQYTPTTCETDIGHFDVIIKIYPNGQMGNYLKNLPIGSMVSVKGPLGSLNYTGKGNFVIKRKNEDGTATMKTYNVKNINMVAGGSGITPMLQIIRNISSNPADGTKLSLCFANQAEGDIMCRDELEAFSEKNSNFKLYLTIDRPSETWTGGTGYLNSEIFKKQFSSASDDSIALLCGPPPMVNAMANHLFTLGYTEDQIFRY